MTFLVVAHTMAFALEHVEVLKPVNDGFAHALMRRVAQIWESTGHNEWRMFVVHLNAISFAVYWAAGLLFLSCDLFEFSWAKKYKTQPGTNTPLSRPKLYRLLEALFVNQFIVGPLVASVAFPLIMWRGVDFRGQPDQTKNYTLATVLRHVTIYFILQETSFYYSHRLFHEVKFLYKNVHKRHHEWVACIGISARYAHPLEDVLSNLTPLALGPLVAGSPIAFWWIYFAAANLSTVIAHSGYHFPFIQSPELHDFHHLAFDVNYGSFGLMDELHGTDEKFLKSRQYLRHHMLRSFKSAREEVPDEVSTVPVVVVDTTSKKRI